MIINMNMTKTTISNLRILLAAHPDPVRASDLDGRSITRMLSNDPPLIELWRGKAGYLEKVESLPKLPRYKLTVEGLARAQALPPVDDEQYEDEPVRQPVAATANGHHDEPVQVEAQPVVRMAADHDCDCPERDELALVYQIAPELRQHVQALVAIKRRMGGA